MDFFKKGEQALEGGNSNNQSQGNSNNMQQQQQQGSSNNNNNSGGGGGGFMKGLEQNSEDAYINNTVNGFLTKEGVPGAADGVIDGAMDTEINKYQKDL